ncbi:hypothetical protein RRG08_006939 [Elysia crispata]|uniref:Uncharacterized protein n=1 Tax=Elysia crispata TaxID=231223 RepID=A0AAE1D3K0_9GAST|nr:hypothetical protein RRG08_006939 [Elysia crispata]
MPNHLITIKPRISPDTTEATIRRSDDQGERGNPGRPCSYPRAPNSGHRVQQGRGEGGTRDKDIDSLSFNRTPEPCYQIAITCDVPSAKNRTRTSCMPVETFTGWSYMANPLIDTERSQNS